MKKFIIAMAVILLVGGILSGIGCVVYFNGNQKLNFENPEYVENVFVAESAFDSVELDFNEPHTLKFERGDTYSVKYSTNQYSDTTVSAAEGKLRFQEKPWNWKTWIHRLFCRFSTTEVVITVPRDVVLTIDANIGGASDITLPSWQYGNIDMDIHGAACVTGDSIEASDINISISGGAKIDLTGNMKNIRIDSSGSSDISLAGKAKELRVYASGSSDIVCTQFDSPLINIEMSGSADITLKGTGDVLNLHSSGSSEIYAREFAVSRAILESSGSVNAQINVSQYLSVSASGSADVEYWGNPDQVDKSLSGSASVVHRD